MARTESNKVSLGTKAPYFKLLNTVDNKWYSLNELQGKNGTVVFFICNHCPFVHHVNQALINLAETYKQKEINCIAISSNDIENYPMDAPDKMQEVAKTLGYPFPYLFDETQETAKAYNAACTPDFYIFDANLSLVYHGQLDDSRPGNGLPVTGGDIKNALDNLLLDGTILKIQKPSLGCGIKWKQ